MKISISQIITSFFAKSSQKKQTSPTAKTNSSLKLHFSLKRHERSKDSNSTTVTIDIENGTITFSEKRGGFRAGKDENFTKKLTKENEEQIIKFIEEKSFNISLTEDKKIDGYGTSKHFQFEIESPYKAKISINGKSRISGTDSYVKRKWGRKYIESRTNIKNIEYVNNADNFIMLIKMIKVD